MRTMRAICCVAMFCAVVEIQPASAHGIVAYQSGAGNLWAAFKVTIPEDGAFEAVIQTSQESTNDLAIGYWLIGPDRLDFWSEVFSAQGSGPHIQTSATGPIASQTRWNGGWTHMSVSYDARDQLTAGTYTILLVSAATQGRSGAAWLLGDSSIQLVAQTSGNEAFLHDLSDFDGTANIETGNGAVVSSATVAGSVQRVVRGQLFGFFECGSRVGVCKYSFDGPGGNHQGGGRFNGSVDGSGKPGDYTFRLDAAVLALYGSANVWGADVALP